MLTGDMRIQNAHLDKLRGYMDLADVGEIARRYAAMNAFDGILTIMGVLLGCYTAHVRDPRVVVSTGMATALAVGISGLWGAYLTETAERKRSLGELEQSVLADLKSTRLGRRGRHGRPVSLPHRLAGGADPWRRSCRASSCPTSPGDGSLAVRPGGLVGDLKSSSCPGAKTVAAGSSAWDYPALGTK